MGPRTNALRLIDAAAVDYEVRTYELEPGRFSAEAVASLIDLPESRVFKTLVARGERTGPCFAAVPGGRALDLRELAKAAGDKRMALVAVRDVEPLTGYRRGSVTAIGASRRLPVYLDSSCDDHDRIAVSAGAMGVQVLLSPRDYVALTRAVIVAISRPADGVDRSGETGS